MLIVCYFNKCIILMLCVNVLSDNAILKLSELSRSMNWLNWLCIDLVIEGLYVQTLLRTNLTFFLPNFLLT